MSDAALEDAPALHDAPPDGIDAYRGLDLTENSDLCRELLAGLDREHSDHGRVHLTDELGAYPCGLTPQMLAWLDSHVQPLRTAALHQLQAAFGGSTLGKTAVGRGTLVAAERWKIEQIRLQTYNRIHTDLRRNHQELLDERDARRRDFEQARAEHGDRDPVMTNPGIYWGGLIAAVGMEIAVNFESLMKLPMIKSGLFATGLALLLGLAVGFAAHVHGTVLKQWHYWFNSFDNTRVWQASRKVAIGGVLLSLALGMVGWARMFYVTPLIELADVTGETPPNLFLSIAFMTLSNVIVYGVGVIWAYFHHDLDPEYPPKKAAQDQADAPVRNLTRAINGRLKEADDKAAQELARLDALEKAQKTSDSWSRNNGLVASVRAVDRKVEAALQRYKTALIGSLKGQTPPPTFIQPTVTRDDAAREIHMNGSQYLGRPVKLRGLGD